MKGPSKIQKYNNIVGQAASNERAGDWRYAVKLWEAALAIARLAFWKNKVTWCENRMAFCTKMAERVKE